MALDPDWQIVALRCNEGSRPGAGRNYHLVSAQPDVAWQLDPDYATRLRNNLLDGGGQK